MSPHFQILALLLALLFAGFAIWRWRLRVYVITYARRAAIPEPYISGPIYLGTAPKQEPEEDALSCEDFGS